MTSPAAPRTVAPRTELLFWIATAIVLVSALVSLGYSVAGVLDDGANDDYALYAASRSVALALAAVVPILTRSRTAVFVVGGAMTVVQLLDGFVGLSAGDALKTYGPWFTALATLVALLALHRAQRATRPSEG